MTLVTEVTEVKSGTEKSHCRAVPLQLLGGPEEELADGPVSLKEKSTR
jgi:hypothetical protein